MIRYRRALLHSMVATLFAVVPASILATVAVVIVMASSGRTIPHVIDPSMDSMALRYLMVAGMAAFVAMFAALAGVFPALLGFAPLYALLMKFRMANYIFAAAVGAVPGLVLISADYNLAVLFLLYGVPVGICAHYIAKRMSERILREQTQNRE